jgi:hypothetical protein
VARHGRDELVRRFRSFLTAARGDMVRAIFDKFAVDAVAYQGVMDAGAYKEFLKGIDRWGKAKCYEDATWPREWVQECEKLGAQPVQVSVITRTFHSDTQ